MFKFERGASATAKLLSCGLSAAAILAGGAGLAAVTPGDAHAQTSGAQANTGDNDIVVTARRRSERLQDVPVAVTAMSGKQMENLNVSSVAQLATFVPSMVVGRQVTGAGTSIFLRGVGSTSLSAGFDQSVSFNIDGIAMSRGREMMFAQYDVQSVEVLKGPQALFFGRNTTGGLVNLATNGPSDEFEGKGKVGYGFENAETYGEGVISGPLNDSLGARFAFRVANSEGAALVNTARAALQCDPTVPGNSACGASTQFLREPVGKYRGAYESISGRLTLDYHPTSDFHMTFKGALTTYSDDSSSSLYERVCGSGRTVPQAVITSGVVTTVPDPYAECNNDFRTPHSNVPAAVVALETRMPGLRDGIPYMDLDSGYAVLNITKDFANLSLNSITGYYGFKQEDLNDFLGATAENSGSNLYDWEQWSEELRLSTKFDGPVNFTTGVFLSNGDFQFNTYNYLRPIAYDPVNLTFTTFNKIAGFTHDTTSVFGEVTWNIIPTIELDAGARWSRDERDSFEYNAPAATANAAAFPTIATGKPQINDHFADENVSPQVTLSYRPTHDLSFYVAYKEGYKNGGFNVSQTITAAATAATGHFNSETADGWEAGMRSEWLDGHLRLNLTVYDYTYSDLQVQFYNPVTNGQVVANAGRLVTKGVEGEINYSPAGFEPLSLHSSFAYNDASYEDFTGQCYTTQTFDQGCNQQLNPAGTAFNGQVYNGRTPPKAPEWAANLGAVLEFPLSSQLSTRFSLDANYSSEYNYTDALRPDAVQPSYTRWDASVQLINNTRGWTLALIGRNLTNEFVVNTANELTGTQRGGTGVFGDFVKGSAANLAVDAAAVTADLNAVVQPPREIYLEATLRF